MAQVFIQTFTGVAYNAPPSYKRSSYEIIITFQNFFPSGFLVSGPSISPENSFSIPAGEGNASMVMGPTMDHMIIRDLLKKVKLI